MLRLKYRRIIALILSALLMFGICGVAAADDSSSSRLTLEDKLTAMLPALDSVARAIGVQGEVGYAPRDPQFFWTVIYLMGLPKRAVQNGRTQRNCLNQHSQSGHKRHGGGRVF